MRLAPVNVAKSRWARAGMVPSDINVAKIYDCFMISMLLQLEDYGFCAKGEGESFAASGSISPSGTNPINTDGGNMSGGYIHGLNHIVEGVPKMRGSADVQIKNAETYLVNRGPIGIRSAMVLRRAA